MDDRRKRPSYPWYPGDWKRDTALQSCPFITRSIWREMCDLMHDGEPYGHLTAGGQPISADALARMIGLAPKVVRGALAELGAKNVYSVTEAGVIFSRRMVRDEAIRLARSEGGIKSLDNPNVPRPKAHEDGPKDTPKDIHKGGGDPAHSNTAVPQQPIFRSPLGVRGRIDVAWPGRPPVPGTLHADLRLKLGGDPDEADAKLRAWYPTVAAQWDGKPIGDDDFAFWRARFREWIGTTVTAVNAKQAERQAARAAFLNRHKESA